MSLSGFSGEELKAELEMRKQAAENPMPTPKPVPDFKNLVVMCQEHIQEIAVGNNNNDTEHYIYEAAINAVYGDEVWKWINKRL